MVRIVAWRFMVRTMLREVVRFIQSRFREVRMNEARYKDLLSEADEHYPRYLSSILSLSDS